MQKETNDLIIEPKVNVKIKPIFSEFEVFVIDRFS